MHGSARHLAFIRAAVLQQKKKRFVTKRIQPFVKQTELEIDLSLPLSFHSSMTGPASAMAKNDNVCSNSNYP